MLAIYINANANTTPKGGIFYPWMFGPDFQLFFVNISPNISPIFEKYSESDFIHPQFQARKMTSPDDFEDLSEFIEVEDKTLT